MTMMTSKKGDVMVRDQNGGLDERGAAVLRGNVSKVTVRGRIEEVSKPTAVFDWWDHDEFMGWVRESRDQKPW